MRREVLVLIVISGLLSSMLALKSRIAPSIRLTSRLFSGSAADTVVGRCTQKISAALNPVKCVVTSTDDDPNGSHIQVTVVSSAFEGKKAMERQRMVYKAIWEEMSGPVHAVDSISAKTPEEANS